MTPSEKAAKRRLEGAKRDLERIQREIAPFTKARKRGAHSTAGQWEATRAAVTRHASKT
jgi:hypothetical protein